MRNEELRKIFAERQKSTIIHHLASLSRCVAFIIHHFLCSSLQSRSPLPRASISASAVAILVATGILWLSHRRMSWRVLSRYSASELGSRRKISSTAVGARKHTANLKPRSFAYIFSRGGCSANIVLGKHSAISYAEFGDKLFSLIVGDNCYFHIISSFLAF